MNEKDLLKVFLAAFPDSSHPKDRERFVAYAVACVKSGKRIDSDAMSEVLSPDEITNLEIAFDWIKDTMDYLSSKEIL